MTAACNRALDLYPEPEQWTPALGLSSRKPLTPEERALITRQLLLRTSITSDCWPLMVRAFRVVMRKEIPTDPRTLTPEEKMHHGALLFSELSEFNESGTLLDQADGLFDLIYVALGALVNMGLSNNQILAGFAEVQASNMTKVQDNGTPLINDGVLNPEEPIGKVLKTHNYIPVDLAEAMSLGQE